MYYRGSIASMKVSVSLPDDDLEFVDTYATERGYESRSAVFHHAVRLLRAAELASDYEGAWAEWTPSADADLWESTAGDGGADGTVRRADAAR